MNSREIIFLIGFAILGITPLFAQQLVSGATELLMLAGMIISMSTAFINS